MKLLLAIWRRIFPPKHIALRDAELAGGYVARALLLNLADADAVTIYQGPERRSSINPSPTRRSLDGTIWQEITCAQAQALYKKIGGF